MNANSSIQITAHLYAMQKYSSTIDPILFILYIQKYHAITI